MTFTYGIYALGAVTFAMAVAHIAFRLVDKPEGKA